MLKSILVKMFHFFGALRSSELFDLDIKEDNFKDICIYSVFAFYFVFLYQLKGIVSKLKTVSEKAMLSHETGRHFILNFTIK